MTTHHGSRGARWRVAAAVLSALLIVGSAGLEPADAGPPDEPVWDLQKDEAAVFRLVPDAAAAQGSLSLPHGGEYIVYATELVGTGTVGHPVGSLAELLEAHIFRTPIYARRKGKFSAGIDIPRTDYGRLKGSGGGKRTDDSIRARYEIKGIGGDATLARLDSAVIDVELELRGEVPGVAGGAYRIEAVTLPPAAGASGAPTRIVAAGTIELVRTVSLRDPSFSDEVREAIAKGRKFLEGRLNRRLEADEKASLPPKHSMGNVCLETFALLRSGVKPNADVIKRAFAYLEGLPLELTYDVALYIMAIEARRVTREEAAPENGYATVARYKKNDLLPKELDRIRELVQWLLAARNVGHATWHYRNREHPEHPKTANAGDHSNTQFAILALHAAERSGVEIPVELWREVAQHFTNTQEPNGPEVELFVTPLGRTPPGADPAADPNQTRERRRRGTEAPAGLHTDERGKHRARGWGYGVGSAASPDSGYGSMSCAGISSLAIAKESLQRLDAYKGAIAARTDKALDDGLAWAQLHFTPRTNSYKGLGWFFYYLYSVEKAGEIAGVESFGLRPWWAEGALHLVETQEGSGAWANSPRFTSFALLFLNRATIPPKILVEKPGAVATGEKRGTGPGGLDDIVHVEGLGLVSLGQAIGTLDTGDPRARRENLAVVKKSFESMDARRRPIAIPALLKALKARDPSVRKFARWALEEATDVKKIDGAGAQNWYELWRQVVNAPEKGSYDKVPLFRGTVRGGDASMPMRRAIIETLMQLRAVEGCGEIIGELNDRDLEHRKFAWSMLRALMGGDGGVAYEPGMATRDRKAAVEQLRAYWEKNRADLILRGQLERAVAVITKAGPRAEAPLGQPPPKDEPHVAEATKKLLAAGDRSIGLLVDALLDERSVDRAMELLEEITGEFFDEASEWRTWWRAKGAGS